MSAGWGTRNALLSRTARWGWRITSHRSVYSTDEQDPRFVSYLYDAVDVDEIDF